MASKQPVKRQVDNYYIKGFKEELYYAIHLAVTNLFGPDVYQRVMGASGPRNPEFITFEDPDNGEIIRMPVGTMSIGSLTEGEEGLSGRHPWDDDDDDDDYDKSLNINIKCYYNPTEVQMILNIDAPESRNGEAEKLIALIKDFSRTKSFLQNKVLKVFFDEDSDGQKVDIIPVSKIKGHDVYIYNNIRTGLVPIICRLTDQADSLGINNKYSLLLHGRGGTGKTSMMFNYVAPIAIQNGYTVIFCENAKNYENILDVAEVMVTERGWKVITIVEDIDQAFDGEIRGEMQQNILNKIDAGYNKDMKLINVMTTNYIDRISSFMLRAGRISKLLHVGGIPADDVIPFCSKYIGTMYDTTADYSAIVPLLVDMPASFIREIIDEAKTLAFSDNQTVVSVELLSNTIESYKYQESLTLKKGYGPKDKVVDAIRTIFDVVGINVENMTILCNTPVMLSR